MEAGSPQPTISERARRCLVSFQECLAGMITLGPIRKSLIENEFARFSIWTSNVGVFASGRASIDYHLRKEPSIQRLVLGLLEVLHGRIEQYLNALKIINNPLPLQSKEQAVAAHGDLQRAVESMAREIALLHDLTRTIRRASKKANDVEEAISFRIEDEKGNNVEERLANYFAANIRHQFPRLSNIIRLRLAEAMVIRRRRIIYKRLRYPKDPTKTIQPTIQPIIQQPNSIQTEDTVIISQHAGRPEVMTHLKPMGLFISKSLDKIVTPVAPKSFQKAATPPVVSQLQAMSLRSHEDYAFPSPPKHVPAATEVLCPFCLIMLPIQEVQNEERWRDHVMADLYPYVCLTDNCDRPDEIYRHSEEWLRHTRKHSLRWRCASRAHNSMLFDTKDEYIGHLKSKHRRTVSDNQIAALANRSLQLTGPLFKSCPFCGIEEQSGRGRLQEHIIDHLQSLALKSLPPIDDENEQTNNLNRSQEEDFNTSFRKQIIPQTDTPDITTFLSATSVSVPEARLAIKSRYYTTEMITTGTDIILSGKTPSQGGIIYVSQLPEDVDYTIKIELEEPLPHSVVKIIECQIVYDPGSDNCVFINWTRSILSLSNLRQLNSSKILEVNRMCIIQPGAWGIKLHGVDDATDSGLVFQIWLRERRHAIAIAQENSPLQNQAIEDSHRSAKRQRINASPAVDIIPQGSNSTTDWDIEAKDNIMTVDSDIFDLQDGGLAMIHTPISTPIFQTHHFPAGYQIKRIGKISEKGTTSILRCDHSLIAGGLAMKVLQYKHKSPSSLVQLSELWKQEKSTLKKLDHVRFPFHFKSLLIYLIT
ncbi:hypothetical protein GGI43DRAFT_54469 [Trichoderma evansii]